MKRLFIAVALWLVLGCGKKEPTKPIETKPETDEEIVRSITEKWLTFNSKNQMDEANEDELPPQAMGSYEVRARLNALRSWKYLSTKIDSPPVFARDRPGMKKAVATAKVSYRAEYSSWKGGRQIIDDIRIDCEKIDGKWYIVTCIHAD